MNESYSDKKVEMLDEIDESLIKSGAEELILGLVNQLDEIFARILEINAFRTHIIIFSPEGASNLIKFLSNKIKELPSELLNAITMDNLIISAEATRKLFEASGILDLLNKLRLKLKRVYIVYKKGLTLKLPESIKITDNNIYISSPFKQEDIDKVIKFTLKHFPKRELFDKIAMYAVVYLLLKNAAYSIQPNANTLKFLSFVPIDDQLISAIEQYVKDNFIKIFV